MPALFFPNLDALRLALASGLVPTTVARAPARAGFGDHGHLWLEPDELPSREALTSPARDSPHGTGRKRTPPRPDPRERVRRGTGAGTTVRRAAAPSPPRPRMRVSGRRADHCAPPTLAKHRSARRNALGTRRGRARIV